MLQVIQLTLSCSRCHGNMSAPTPRPTYTHTFVSLCMCVRSSRHAAMNSARFVPVCVCVCFMWPVRIRACVCMCAVPKTLSSSSSLPSTVRRCSRARPTGAKGGEPAGTSVDSLKYHRQQRSEYQFINCSIWTSTSAPAALPNRKFTMKFLLVCCLLIGAAVAAEEPSAFAECFEKDSIACVQTTVRTLIYTHTHTKVQ